MGYKVTKHEMERFEESWDRIKLARNPKEQKEIVDTIDRCSPVKTLSNAELLARHRAANAKSRAKDQDKDRKNFASWLRCAHGLAVEDLARLYDKQGRKCLCGKRIGLNRDYRLVRDGMLCISCSDEV